MNCFFRILSRKSRQFEDQEKDYNKAILPTCFNNNNKIDARKIDCICFNDALHFILVGVVKKGELWKI